MATAIFFNGRRINVPQAVSQIDASALAGVSPAAVGIVALVGTAEGGKPLDVSDELDLTRADAALDRYLGGNLRAATQFCFQPSTDPAVPGGAQRIVPVKVNPATQASATLSDSTPADALVITSKDYGLFANQINVQVGTGTNQGKKLTVIFEDETEIFDDVGGDNVLTVDYNAGSDGYDTMLATLNATLFRCVATKAETGLTAQRSADIGAPGVLRFVSDNASDTTQLVTAYGLNGSGAPIRETVQLNGTTPVLGTLTFATVLGTTMSAAALGTVLVTDTVPTTLYSLTAGQTARGVVVCTNMPAAGALTSIAIDTLANVDVALFGLNSTGSAAGETFNFNATLSQAGVTQWSRIDVIALGDVAGARTVTLTINAVNQTHASYKTVQKTVDRLNALDGFVASSSVSNASSYLMANLDYVTGQSVLTAYNFKGDLYACIDKLTRESAYVSGSRATNGAQPPANTSTPVYLAGGSEGTTTITQWQEAFSLLKKRRVNIIVPLTEDPAVHALLAAHLVERAGRLRSEANGYVGIGTANGAGETKSNVKSQIRALSTRHVSAVAQEIQKFDPDTGEATFYPPWMTAVVAAGMQAGSAIGEPLTFKKPTCTDIRNDASWSPIDDIEEMIDAGLMVLEKVDNVGIRWVRSITTHLADDNVVFTEMSANESLNTAVFRLRRQLEIKVGSRGLASSVGAVKGLANDELGRLVDDEIIVAYRNLTVEQIGDVFPVSVEMAPVLPINFIPITIHLTVLRAAA